MEYIYRRREAPGRGGEPMYRSAYFAGGARPMEAVDQP